MLEKNDIKQLKELLSDLESRIYKKMDQKFDVYDQKMDQKFDVYDQKMDQKFDVYDQKMDQKFDVYDQKMDQKLSVQRFDIERDNKSVIDEKLKPIYAKLDRLLTMESEDIGAAYDDIKNLKKRVAKLEHKLA